MTSTIPRFLLPQTARIWRHSRAPNASATSLVLVRYVSAGGKTPSSKARVLEKPERFNPPSHGSRLPRKTTPRHYGGELSADEVQAQGRKDYPGVMAPDGTWSYWFWHSRSFHLFITMSTLTGLAAFTFVQNFRHNSPFVDLFPSASDFLYHPVTSVQAVAEVIRLSEAHNASIVQERRRQRVDDVVKRSQYRKAHGLNEEQGFGRWMTKPDDEPLEPVQEGDAQETRGPRDAVREPRDAVREPRDVVREPRDVVREPRDAVREPRDAAPEPHEPRKKWLGIF